WSGVFQLLVATVLTAAGVRIANCKIRYVYFALLLLLRFDADSVAFLSMAALLSWLDEPGQVRDAVPVGGLLILSVYALVKFTFFITAIVCTASILVSLWGSGSRRAASLALTICVGAGAVLWILCGQSLSNFPTYVSRSVQLASGYTEAMSRP